MARIITDSEKVTESLMRRMSHSSVKHVAVHSPLGRMYGHRSEVILTCDLEAEQVRIWLLTPLPVVECGTSTCTMYWTVGPPSSSQSINRQGELDTFPTKYLDT